MGLDIQSRRRKAREKETLAKRLARERKEKREKEREEEEMSRITDNPLADLAAERPNAPEIKEGVSLASITGNPAGTFRPNRPPKPGGPIDWESVAASNPGQPKKPVVFIPPGSQEAEADKLLPGGQQGPLPPPEDNTIDQFDNAAKDAAKEPAEPAEPVEAEETEEPWDGHIDKMTLDGRPMGSALTDDTGVEARGLLDDVDDNLNSMMDGYQAENPIEIEGDQEADPEALAEDDLFPDRKVKDPNSLPGPEEDGGMMNVGEEEEEPSAKVNPIQAARAKRRSAEFWSQRTRAPVQDVMDVMDLAEQELLAENPNATPEEIKQAQIVALETDEDLARHKEVHGDQIQAAVDRQADQTNRARIMGVPRGMVMMLDQINDAQTPDEIVKGLITAAGVYPQFRPMLQSVITGQVSANALKSQLAAAMVQANTQRYVADAGRPLPKEPDRNPQAIATDLKNPTFDSQGVQKASFALMEGGIEGDAKFNQVVLSFAPQMRAVSQQILNGETPIQADLNTAREVIQLAIGDGMPSAAQVNRLFGGGMTGSQIEKVVYLLYGEAGVRNLHTLGNLRGNIKDLGVGDPATWFGYDDVDDVG